MMTQQRPEEGGPESAKDGANAMERMEVLIVEDNPGDLRLIEEGLSTVGIDIVSTIFTDGGDALDYVRDIATKPPTKTPDLAIVDINLPTSSGHPVLETLTLTTSLDCEVMILTSTDDPNHIERAAAVGANAYFVKPSNPEELFAILRTAVSSLAHSGVLPAGKLAEDQMLG